MTIFVGLRGTGGREPKRKVLASVWGVRKKDSVKQENLKSLYDTSSDDWEPERKGGGKRVGGAKKDTAKHENLKKLCDIS